MYLALILLPFLGSAAAGLRGRALGSTGSQLVATVCLVLSACLSLVAFYEVALCRSPVTIVVGDWLTVGVLQAQWAFSFDDLTVAMLLPVLCVSSAVHVYSMSYMAEDPHTPRFFSYLSLFTGSMALLVTADSYPLMFIGWELIGVASFLLIGFWLTRVQASKAANKAMMVNRVGDTSLSIGFFLALAVFGSLDYATILSTAPLLNETVLTVIGLLFLGGAMSKSAQLPLHTWLADELNLITGTDPTKVGTGTTPSSSGEKTGPGTNPGSYGNKGASAKKDMPTSMSPDQVAAFVAMLVAGPFQMFSKYLTSGLPTARLSIKRISSMWSQTEWEYVQSLMTMFMVNKPVTTEVTDNRRPHLPPVSFTLMLTSTLPALWPLYSLFYLTPAGPGVRRLTAQALGCYNLHSLVVHIILSAYRDTWREYFSQPAGGLVLPLWSGAEDYEYDLFAARLRSLGVPALSSQRPAPHGRRTTLYYVWVPTEHLHVLDELIGAQLPVWARHLVR